MFIYGPYNHHRGKILRNLMFKIEFDKVAFCHRYYSFLLSLTLLEIYFLRICIFRQRLVTSLSASVWMRKTVQNLSIYILLS